ncbi:unnamed protein product [Prunus armeniaca]
MEGVLTLAGPRLDWGTMVGMLRLVWLCAFSYASDAVVVLQLNILGVKMVTPLGHLDDTRAKELHLGLEIDLR